MSFVIALAGLIAYRLTFNDFKGVAPFLLLTFVINLFLPVSGNFAVIVSAGFVPWVVANFALGKSNEQSRKLALFTFGFALLLPFILGRLNIGIN